MMEITNSLEPFKLLQPDLLTEEELSSVLKSKCVKADWSSLSKEKLVELFKRVALPLPQREYPKTARGIKLTKLRQRQENAVKFEDSSKATKQTFTIGINGMTSSAVTIKDRLKPPPCVMEQNSSTESKNIATLEPIKVESRKIKIKSSSSTTNPLDKIIINDHKKQRLDKSEGNVGKNEQTEHNPTKNGSQDKPEVLHTTKKITLKRNHLHLQVESAKDSETKGVVVEKKRKTITWP